MFNILIRGEGSEQSIKVNGYPKIGYYMNNSEKGREEVVSKGIRPGGHDPEEGGVTTPLVFYLDTTKGK